jgi:hypothetical protein
VSRSRNDPECRISPLSSYEILIIRLDGYDLNKCLRSSKKCIKI